MTRLPDAAVCGLGATTAGLSPFEDPGEALSLLVDTGGARSLCAEGAMVIAAMVSVRRRLAQLQSAQRPRGPTTAAAAVTTVTAIGFAHNTDTNAKGRQGGGLLPPSSRFRVPGQGACSAADTLNSASDAMLSFFINDWRCVAT